MTKMYKTPEADTLRWSIRRRSKTADPINEVVRGRTIEPGDKYVLFAWKPAAEGQPWTPEHIHRSEVTLCSLCRVPIYKEGSWYCCDAHAEESFRRGNMEFEEHMFDRGLHPGRITG